MVTSNKARSKQHGMAAGEGGHVVPRRRAKGSRLATGKRKQETTTRSYALNDPTNFIVEEWPRSKRDLYEAARSLFWERGFSEASLQDIVERAGLTKGAFYHYFSAKEDVLRVMFERTFERMSRAMVEHSNKDDPIQSLKVIIREMVRAAIDYHVEVSMFWEQYRNLPGPLRESNRKRRLGLFNAIAKLFSKGIEKGLISADIRPGVASMSVIGMCQNTAYWYNPEGAMTPDEVADMIIRIILNGVVPRNV